MTLPVAGVNILTCSLQHDEQSIRAAMRLAASEWKIAVRIYGGCGGMNRHDYRGMKRAIACGLAGFRGVVVIGASQMLNRRALARNCKLIVPGITEVIPRLLVRAPQATVLGIAARQSDLIYLPGIGIVIFDGLNPKDVKSYITFIHPDLNVCLLLQHSSDRPVRSWRDEWEMALRLMEVARTEAGFRTAYIMYNGGHETEEELLATVRLPHDLGNPRLTFIVGDSGRIATRYAKDRAFVDKYHKKGLVICTKASLPAALRDHGITRPEE